MRVLCWTDYPPEILPVPRCGVEQVHCGPACRERIFGEIVLTLAASYGDEAVASVLARLPAEQHPEMFVRIFDPQAARTLRLPSSLTGPKILVVGECVYPGTPIQAAIAEARTGGYDAVVYPGARSDVTYFDAAGLRTRVMPLVDTVASEQPDVRDIERAAEFEAWVHQWTSECAATDNAASSNLLELTLCEAVRSVRAESGRIAFVCSAKARNVAGDAIAKLEGEGMGGEAGGTAGAHFLVLAAGEVLPDNVGRFRGVCWIGGAADGVTADVAVAQRRGFTQSGATWAVRPVKLTPGEIAATAALDRGDYVEAVAVAKGLLQGPVRSSVALRVMAEAALDAGNRELFDKLANRLRVEAPADPRWRELEQRAKAGAPSLRVRRLIHYGWRELVRNPTAAKASGILASRADPKSPEVLALAMAYCAQQGDVGSALAMAPQLMALPSVHVSTLVELGLLLLRNGRELEAFDHLLHVATLSGNNSEAQFALAEVAVRIGRPDIAEDALKDVPAWHRASALANKWQAKLREALPAPEKEERDLIVCYCEVSRFHGSGVLVKRMFAGGEPMITVRSLTLYGGVVEIPGEHFTLRGAGFTIEQRMNILSKLLKRFRIRRVLAVPFAPEDFENAIAIQRLTGAPLCTYVMDDQTLHASNVPSEIARQALAASALRLAISAEMRDAYEARFGLSMGVVPPLMDSLALQTPNYWQPTGEAPRGVLVGNIWSAGQLEQLRSLVRASGLQLDWFGNTNLSWYGMTKEQLERDGIRCRGFIPESELAATLATYPFVVVPSGMLDGTEKDEWLTRLSLPSRMVFILTQSFTPMLVLGSPETAAARFVVSLGVGRSSSYQPDEAARAMAELTHPDVRAECIQNAKTATPAFVYPNYGEWIWASLAAGEPLPASWQAYFERPQLTSGEASVA